MFVSFRVREDRLDHFLYEELIEKRKFEDLWTLFKQLLTLSDGQASVERGFSVNKDVVAPNLEEMTLMSIRPVQSSVLVNNMKVADFVINEDLLSSCSHVSSRHKMYLKEKKTEKAKKRKALQELTVAKKKRELQRVAEQIVEVANKKAKEAEKRKIRLG